MSCGCGLNVPLLSDPYLGQIHLLFVPDIPPLLRIHKLLLLLTRTRLLRLVRLDTADEPGTDLRLVHDRCRPFEERSDEPLRVALVREVRVLEHVPHICGILVG